MDVDLLYQECRDCGPSRLAAIRYLGGILELPTFWSKEQYPFQRFAATRLFSRTVELIEDLDMESESPELEIDAADVEGPDILSTSILVGTNTWISRLDPVSVPVVNECWFQAFVSFLSRCHRCGYESCENFIPLCLFSLASRVVSCLLLRSPKAEIVLPNAWFYATHTEWKLLE